MSGSELTGRPELPPYPFATEEIRPALAGLRIVDFSRVLAGPYATQLLSDFGAEVIKIEQAGKGDDARSSMPEPSIAGESAFYLASNRNKRSIALDLSTADGRQVALDLIATADIVVENFTTRVMQKFELDYPSIKDRFPRLIYCSVSAFGRSGSLANAAGFDSAIAMQGGVSMMNTPVGEMPVSGGVPFIDLSTALNATIGILTALHARTLYGVGQHVETALFDTAVTDLAYRGYQFLASGVSPTANPRKPRIGLPGGLFQAQDGPIYFTCADQKMFTAFSEKVVERPDLLVDERFATVEARTLNNEVLYDVVAEMMATRTRAYWSERLRTAGVACGEVRTVGEALLSPEAQERGLVSEIPHPTAGTVPYIRPPIRLSATPVVNPTAPPLLGQHSVEILRDVLGYDDERIERVTSSGAVEAGKPLPDIIAP